MRGRIAIPHSNRWRQLSIGVESLTLLRQQDKVAEDKGRHGLGNEEQVNSIRD